MKYSIFREKNDKISVLLVNFDSQIYLTVLANKFENMETNLNI